MNNFWTIIFYGALLIVAFAFANLVTDEIKDRMSPHGRHVLGLILLVATIVIIAIGIALGVEVITIQRP